MPRSKAMQLPPVDDDTDTDPPRRKLTSAAASPPPQTSAASSVFALGGKAKRTLAKIDIDAVPIQSGVPVPPPRSGRTGESPYGALLARMKPGDMVELPSRQAWGLIARAKALKIEVTRRRLRTGVLGIWRK